MPPQASLRTLSIAVLAAPLMLAAGAGPSTAQWSSSPTANKQIATESSVFGAAMAVTDLAGGAIFAWGRGSGLAVQRVDAFGFTQWATGGKLLNNTNSMFGPRAVSDGAGGIWCSWMETSASRLGLYVQRVDGAGTELLGTTDLKLTTAGGSNGLCQDDAGGVIVGWRQDRTGSGDSLYVRRVGAAGDTTNWGPYGVLYASGPRGKSVDVLLPSVGNGCIVGWHVVPNVNLADPDTFFFQRYDGAGAPQWPTPGAPAALRLITPDETSILKACVGASGSIFFLSHRNDSLYLHRLQSTGAFSSPPVGWALGGPPSLRARTGLANAMIPDGAGGVVLAWRDESYTVPTARVRAKRVNASGVSQWPAPGGSFVEVCASSNDQNFPVLVREGRGHFVVSWEDYRNLLNTDLYAQTLDQASGALLWPAAGFRYAGATDMQSGATLAPANPGNVIAAFQDSRSGNARLYAQFIGDPGLLVPAQTVTFSTVQSLPEPHSAAGYTTAGNSLYVMGGGGVPNTINPSLLRFDPGAGWTTLGTGYVPRAFGSLAHDVGTDELIAFNGHDFVNYQSATEAIPLPGGAAALRAPNPTPTEGTAVAANGGLIFSIGGNNDVIGGRLPAVRAFAPGGNAWSSAYANLLPARALHTAAAYGGKIYAVGGDASTGLLRRVDVYDIAGNAWTQLPDAPMPIAGHAVSVTGSLLWFLGDSGNGLALMSYNPPSGTWTMYATNMIARRYASAGGLGTKLVITGGANGSPSRDVLTTQMVDVAAALAAAPVAAVTLPVAASGLFTFAEPGETTGVSLDFSSLAGAGSVTVTESPGPAAAISFSGDAPADTGSTRWVITQTGLSPFAATLRIDLDGLPDGFAPGPGVVIYHRPVPGTGPFAALPTSYDAATNSVSAPVTGFSEFILGTSSLVAVDDRDRGARLALATAGPNPSRGPLSFVVQLPAKGTASLEVLDLQGRRVVQRDLSALGPGPHVVAAEEGRTLPAGVYFGRLTFGEQSVRVRVVRLR